MSQFLGARSKRLRLSRRHLIEVPNQQNEIIRMDVPNKNSLINIWVEGTHFEHEEDVNEDDSTKVSNDDSLLQDILIIHSDGEKPPNSGRGQRGAICSFRDITPESPVDGHGYFNAIIGTHEQRMFTRLDHDVANMAWIDLFSSSKVSHLARTHSNHSSILVELSCEINLHSNFKTCGLLMNTSSGWLVMFGSYLLIRRAEAEVLLKEREFELLGSDQAKIDLSEATANHKMLINME
ncbi:hypothetical protein LIER_34015 [Lithospermum erythrorhizon]|uniref:Uncharacterized protein n=1 Tax=Lithospermum erythrorhizon TaxID=34254 RepID=A0AAV3RZT0_LITER